MTLSTRSLLSITNERWAKTCPSRLPADTPAQTAAARVRSFERHGAASLRALSGVRNAEYRARRLRVGGENCEFASPHLVSNFADVSLAHSRGVVDSLGLRLRHSDAELHRQLAPEHPFARILFDVIEQLRCESLAAPELKGLRSNINTTFLEWCTESHGNGMVETEWGIWLYTAIHMVRARLVGTIEDEIAEGIIEVHRGEAGQFIGADLKLLRPNVNDQQAFSEPAIRITEFFARLAGEGDDEAEEDRREARFTFFLPPGWTGTDVDGVHGGPGGGGVNKIESDADLDLVGGYHVFNNEFDVEASGASLYSKRRRAQLRTELDTLVAAQALSAPRLGRELKLLFAEPETDGSLFGLDEGLIDGRLLSLLVSSPGYEHVFKQDHIQPRCDSVVSFLVDNSGSMKSQRYRAVAVLLDTFARALSLAGVTTEVLGFTTAAWVGGEPIKQWRAQGQPEDPGRLGETLHIVYKEADTSWRRARSSIASLLETKHLREGVDGEAVIWAYRRLLARNEKRKHLVVISDGSPMDSATSNANRDGFLFDHLRDVSNHIHRAGLVRLGAIGIDLDLSDFYPNSVDLDLNGTLGQASYRVLQDLFLH
jgi:cobaltochelatase CobT